VLDELAFADVPTAARAAAGQLASAFEVLSGPQRTEDEWGFVPGPGLPWDDWMTFVHGDPDHPSAIGMLDELGLMDDGWPGDDEDLREWMAQLVAHLSYPAPWVVWADWLREDSFIMLDEDLSRAWVLAGAGDVIRDYGAYVRELQLLYGVIGRIRYWRRRP
jgi:hypothetical protein